MAPVHDNNTPSATGLAGLTFQQVVDLDVEGLAVKIDEHHCRTKKAVLVGNAAAPNGFQHARCHIVFT